MSKKRAVATGVLPSQLSPASNTDGKPGVKSLPLKKSEKQVGVSLNQPGHKQNDYS